MFNDYYMRLVKCIDDGLTCNEICNYLNISRKQLYNFLLYLRNDGINFNRKYLSNGVLIYEPVKRNRELIKDNTINLYTEYGSSEEKILVISDLHFGNEKERIDLLKRVYEYCKENDIHVIFNTGDIIDGTFTKGIKERDAETIYKQVKHIIDDYPFDKNIINFGVLGDHDDSIRIYRNINLKDILDNKRHDICVGGFNNTTINIKNDCINLYHHLNGGSINNSYSPIVIKGHSHVFNINKRDDGVIDINAPSLSNVSIYSKPACLLLDLKFTKGYINEVEIKEISFEDKEETIYDNKFEINTSKREKIDYVKYEKSFVKEREEFNKVEEVSNDDLVKLQKKFELSRKRGKLWMKN